VSWLIVWTLGYGAEWPQLVRRFLCPAMTNATRLTERIRRERSISLQVQSRVLITVLSLIERESLRKESTSERKSTSFVHRLPPSHQLTVMRLFLTSSQYTMSVALRFSQV
jgi:hypothetical protein